MVSSVIIRAQKAAHIAAIAEIRQRMTPQFRATAKFSDISSMKVGTPDAAMLERMRAVKAASDERAAKAAAAPPPPPPPQRPPDGMPADQDPRYSETTRWALGVAVTARKDLEILQTDVRVYNSLKKALEDPAYLAMIVERLGDEDGAAMIEKRKTDLLAYRSSAEASAANISRSYSISAAPLRTDASGVLELTDFTIGKTGRGWNMAVTSQGAATVIAGGTDVSSLVWHKKMTGELWNPPGAGRALDVTA